MSNLQTKIFECAYKTENGHQFGLAVRLPFYIQ